MDDNSGIRINKYLSEKGICSRREADKYIEQGRIHINGNLPDYGARVQPRDKVKVDGNLVSTPQEDFIYLAFNKPPGIVTTTDQSESDNIISFISFETRIFPIGRLDKPSEGLIFMTNDGDIVNKILRAGNNHEKEYLVTIDRPVTDEFIAKMAGGIPMLGTMTRKCKVERVSRFSFSIILTQGMNRQIRRMCEHLGVEVMRLKRTRIMNVKLDVGEGLHRHLTEDEIAEIKEMVANSSKTQKGPAAKKASTPKKKKAAVAYNSKSRTGNQYGPRKGKSAKSGRKSSKGTRGKR